MLQGQRSKVKGQKNINPTKISWVYQKLSFELFKGYWVHGCHFLGSKVKKNDLDILKRTIFHKAWTEVIDHIESESVTKSQKLGSQFSRSMAPDVDVCGFCKEIYSFAKNLFIIWVSGNTRSSGVSEYKRHDSLYGLDVNIYKKRIFLNQPRNLSDFWGIYKRINFSGCRQFYYYYYLIFRFLTLMKIVQLRFVYLDNFL